MFYTVHASWPLFYLAMITLWVFFLFKSSFVPLRLLCCISKMPVAQSAFLFLVLFREFCHLLTHKFHGISILSTWSTDSFFHCTGPRVEPWSCKYVFFSLWPPTQISLGLLAGPLLQLVTSERDHQMKAFLTRLFQDLCFFIEHFPFLHFMCLFFVSW